MKTILFTALGQRATNKAGAVRIPRSRRVVRYVLRACILLITQSIKYENKMQYTYVWKVTPGSCPGVRDRHPGTQQLGIAASLLSMGAEVSLSAVSDSCRQPGAARNRLLAPLALIFAALACHWLRKRPSVMAEPSLPASKNVT